MSTVLTTRTADLRNVAEMLRLRKEKADLGSRFTFVRKNKSAFGRIRISLAAGVFLVAIILVGAGALYLYQVNRIATQGYEIRGIEKQIKELNQESQNLKIREVELKSMRNIEKSLENSDLVNSSEISYVEIKSPVAMK